MTQSNVVPSAKRVILIRLLMAFVLSLLVLGCFWAAIWHQPTWGRLNDGQTFQIPAWGTWKSRDRLILHYGIPLWLSAAVSAYLATVPLGSRHPGQASEVDRRSSQAGMVALWFTAVLSIPLLLVFGPLFLLIVATLTGSALLFHWLSQPRERPWLSILASPWLWTFSGLPLVGLYGMFAVLLVPLPTISTVLFLVQLCQRSLYRVHWLVLAINAFWFHQLFKFASDWFSIYGD
jgi:hypothetical protein